MGCMVFFFKVMSILVHLDHLNFPFGIIKLTFTLTVDLKQAWCEAVGQQQT